MRIIHPTPETHEDKTAPVFHGHVRGAQYVHPDEGSDVAVHLIEFVDGAITNLHTHSVDQVLIVRDGSGVVGSADHQFEVGPGDVIYTPAGEAHIHGACPGRNMSHYVVMRHGQTDVVDSPPSDVVVQTVGPVSPKPPSAG